MQITERGMAILADLLKRSNGDPENYVFTGQKPGRPISTMGMPWRWEGYAPYDQRQQ